MTFKGFKLIFSPRIIPCILGAILLSSPFNPTWAAENSAKKGKAFNSAPNSTPENISGSPENPGSATGGSSKDSSKVEFSLINICENNKCDLMLPYDAPINKVTVEKFIQSTQSVPAGTVVLMNSSTGDINSGIRLGQYLREKRFNTHIGRAQETKKILTEVDGQCYSACVVAFAGGLNRRVDPGDQVGVFALRANAKAVTDAQFKTAITTLARYFDQMGVDYRLITQMLETKGSAVSPFSLHNIKLFNLDNSERKQTQTWKMHALEDGLLIGLVSERQASNKYSVTLGLIRQSKDFRLTVFIKPLTGSQDLSQLGSFLNNNSRVSLSASNQTMTPNPIKSWEVTSTGIQTSVLLTDKELSSLSSTLEFELRLGQISDNSYGLEGATIFGTSGLKGIVTALRK